MTATFTTEIDVDQKGVARIGKTRFKVLHLVMAKKFYGLDAEGLQEYYPQLTLAEIHAALTYYYEHQSAVDEAVRVYLEESDRLAEQVAEPELQERLNRIVSRRD